MQEKIKDDTIRRLAAIDAIDKRIQFLKDDPVFRRKHGDIDLYGIKPIIRALPPAEPEIIHCKDCKYYSPMNRETKTGICNLTMHQNFGDDWFCAGAERRQE